ncbi:MotE family protein [Mariprofundus ferrooxydans]|uniref:MotE family protein n=1 Tax=Mariprofundus ferrooxydans TaxID=314344 RepID=UPI00037BD2DD|nr:hypothetical protein [Mariprofundus ferrooxydans]
MARRTWTLMLAITLLLVIRVATHLTSPEPQATATVPEQQARTTAPATSQIATNTGLLSQPATTSPETDSLALLETLLIPDAGAAGNPPRQTTAAPAEEDKTLAALRVYKASLDQRATELDQRSNNLQQAEEKLQQRITELEQLEASIQQRLQDEAGIKTKKIKRLTSVYEGMKADKAAPVIAEMELATVVKIFSLMDEKKVGKILSFLPADKAVQISQALTRQISTVK